MNKKKRKQYYGVEIKSSIYDTGLETESFAETWAGRFQGKWNGGSFLDDCWAIVVFRDSRCAKDFVSFLGEFGMKHYAKYLGRNFWFKRRGIYHDRWINGYGKVEIA